ncbi:MAG TPA: CarD family transcriptional regulator [Solirubrobacteraceae bacterium]|nr:CarD family transcriptional regulator [Solirubrobacteraceae bacterium]
MPAQPVDFKIGDSVVYPHHGAGKVLRKEVREVLGETREYLTIKILHNDMTVMVPTENAALAGLRRVIDQETVQKVLAVLSDECSEMPKNWNRRFKHNREKIKTGDIYELAEVVRNLAIRESEKGLSTGEKQMYTRAKRILASELMYALGMDEEQVEEHLAQVLAGSASANGSGSRAGRSATARSAGGRAGGARSSGGAARAARPRAGDGLDDDEELDDEELVATAADELGVGDALDGVDDELDIDDELAVAAD